MNSSKCGKGHFPSECTCGRPTKMTPETINKLEEAFALGCTDKEACFFAGISHETLYNYQEKHPEFVERKEALKESPVLKARQTVIKSLEVPEHAKWYLERKAKAEFAQRTELGGELNHMLNVPDDTFNAIVKRAADTLNESGTEQSNIIQPDNRPEV